MYIVKMGILFLLINDLTFRKTIIFYLAVRFAGA